MESMEKLHALELKIALEIKRICEKHDIAYFLTAGTLLGAVRHEGFIPWDDDMDIGMLRCDYERFAEACRQDLGPEFFFQTWDTDPGFPFSYGKVRLKGTHMAERFAQDASTLCDGLFVDVFPFDSVPENAVEERLQALRYYFCKRILWIKKGMGTSMKSESLKKRMKYYLFKAFAGLFDYDKVKTYYRNTQKKYNGRKTRKVVTDGAYAYRKESIERSWTENLKPVGFEGVQFPAFRDAADYLSYFYGDYMTPPPEDKRGGHDLLEIDFGEYA